VSRRSFCLFPGFPDRSCRCGENHAPRVPRWAARARLGSRPGRPSPLPPPHPSRSTASTRRVAVRAAAATEPKETASSSGVTIEYQRQRAKEMTK